MNIYNSLLKTFTHIHEPAIQEKAISRYKVAFLLFNNVEPQNNVKYILKDDHGWLWSLNNQHYYLFKNLGRGRGAWLA